MSDEHNVPANVEQHFPPPETIEGQGGPNQPGGLVDEGVREVGANNVAADTLQEPESSEDRAKRISAEVEAWNQEKQEKFEEDSRSNSAKVRPGSDKIQERRVTSNAVSRVVAKLNKFGDIDKAISYFGNLLIEINEHPETNQGGEFVAELTNALEILLKSRDGNLAEFEYSKPRHNDGGFANAIANAIRK